MSYSRILINLGTWIASSMAIAQPILTTLPASDISSNRVTLHATVLPGNTSSDVFFQYNTTTNMGVTVSTIAGNGTYGYADGIGNTATLSRPQCVAVDDAGNVYVADMDNHRIRKVAPDGTVTTLAGSGTRGFGDGAGAAAKFDNPFGVAVAPNGVVHVADTYNCKIRRIAPDGTVSTFAGSSYGLVDGVGTAAKLNYPVGMAFDAASNLYVGDQYNHAIRKIAPDGTVTTLAGNGTSGYVDGVGSAARFNKPLGIAVDAQGIVYVADNGNNRIRKITPDGTVSTLAGTGTAGFADGDSAAAMFNWPYGVAVDRNGNVYVGDTQNYRIRMISPDGNVSTLAGTGMWSFADGPGTSAMFNRPNGVAIDQAGNLYVGDQNSYRVRKITQAGLMVAQRGVSGANSVELSLGLADLKPQTTYYFRAYATHATGNAAGTILNFTTTAYQPTPIRLSSEVREGVLTLSWTGNETLQTSPVVTGPYTNIDGAVSPFVIPSPTEPHRFYRLIKP